MHGSSDAHESLADFRSFLKDKCDSIPAFRFIDLTTLLSMSLEGNGGTAAVPNSYMPRATTRKSCLLAQRAIYSTASYVGAITVSIVSAHGI